MRSRLYVARPEGTDVSRRMVSSDRPDLGLHPAGAVEDLRELRAVLRECPAGCRRSLVRLVLPGVSVPSARLVAHATRGAGRRRPVSPGDNVISGWFAGGGRDRGPVDPNLKPPSEDEWVAGVEYEVLPNTRVSLAYTHRNIVRWVEDMSLDRQRIFIGNPGEGAAASFPAASRVYDSVTVAVNKTFADLWLAQVSYSWQNLVGNIEGLFRTQNAQLDPNINTDFDLARLLVNRYGPLAGRCSAYDQGLRLEGVRGDASSQHHRGRGLRRFLGNTDRLSGTCELLRARGSLCVSSRLGRPARLAAYGRRQWRAELPGFREHGPDPVGQHLQPFQLSAGHQGFAGLHECEFIPGAWHRSERRSLHRSKKIVDDQTGEPLQESDVNPNFWRAMLYQPVRQFRFQARLSF